MMKNNDNMLTILFNKTMRCQNVQPYDNKIVTKLFVFIVENQKKTIAAL